ncbi:STAS domain-containing protein [Domibacillus sp. DTU_2020_1001157_1_SI_ALB_TIR_016]|uniref:STAS domain-containing protein n=1 Tax=Domibacillus sp. DTU_2020_1001157_1_SI_ALB_TIR_016 TaxID=3077789 RepID=UPI0028EEA53B|nr:STAS domain-containing protein [Domibacillus sp. DTU_2020_1001157_1_SI_ALB_TIR_016]WNS78146.1 STAS domain-containing protein [Domibacillus sp. DTU_2020_1001157_1_SI_ALB_TIR_016]
MSSFLKFSAYITDNVEALATEVVEKVISNLELTIPDWEKEQARIMYLEFLQFFGDSFVKEEKCVPDFFIEWSRKNADMQTSSGGRVSVMAVRYPPTREVLTDMFTEIGQKLQLSLEQIVLIIKRINQMLDRSLNETIFAFEQLYEEKKEQAKKEMAALSAPIIPVREGIVILPLIGEMDAYRANYILEHVFPKLSDMEIDHLIVDFSGLSQIDVKMAAYLQQLGMMLKLVGIHLITSGLRPDLAQIVVKSGLELSGTDTFSTVKRALESLD